MARHDGTDSILDDKIVCRLLQFDARGLRDVGMSEYVVTGGL